MLQCQRFQGDAGNYFRGADAALPGNSTMLLYSTSLYKILQLHEPHSTWLQLPPPKFSIHQATICNVVGMVFRLLEKGQDINEPDLQSKTPLIHAVGCGHYSLTSSLIEYGAEVNFQHNSERTALYHACVSDDSPLGIIKLLLDHQADVNLQGGLFNTAFQAASARGKLKVVELLLENKADVNLQGGHYNTALQAASWPCAGFEVFTEAG
jgi:ankyrin repeat protein